MFLFHKFLGDSSYESQFLVMLSFCLYPPLRPFQLRDQLMALRDPLLYAHCSSG